MFVRPDKTFDHQKLFDVTYVITKNLNRVIDINYYPVERQTHNHRARRFGPCRLRWMARCGRRAGPGRSGWVVSDRHLFVACVT